MSAFARDVSAALGRTYDVIVVGGGIYGMTLTLEAARRGLRPLLLERDDFGGAASLHSLRILHGGLRYLQDMDLPRFFESVEQRGWFMRHFAPLCRVLPCIMPLYGRGLKRPSIFRVALAINDVLSRRSFGPGGRVLSVAETVALFPLVGREGLQGAALWHDGQILSPQRLHAELLRWAVGCGATVLNYVEVLALNRDGARVGGVETNVGTFRAPVVINAAGAWTREVATRLERDRPELMVPSLTFNVLFDVPPPSDAAVAVEGTRMYFVTPHRAGCTFVGTVHRAWEGVREPTEAMLEEFITDLRRAMPGWNVSRLNIKRVTAGVLPSRGPGQADMAKRSVLVKHDTPGLFSLAGIKYTTAQRFARDTVKGIFGPRAKTVDEHGPMIGERAQWVEPQAVMGLDDDELRALARDESVTRAEDLVERRMDWIVDEGERARFLARLASILALPSAAIAPSRIENHA